MKKQFYKILAFSGLLFGAVGCDKGFDKVNINPVLSTTIDPAYLFSNAQFGSVISTLHYQSEIVQQIITPYTGVLEGGNHNIIYDPNTNQIFNLLYTGAGTNSFGAPVKLLADVLNQTMTNASRSNLYNMARIWHANVFQVLVDTYGDVPYTEAGKAYLENNNLPKYDDQKAIYDDLLKEVSEATKALDATKLTEAGDLFYKGNIAQWKKLGNSLLLRIAMRYTKSDPDKAKQYALIATDPANGGVMQSNLNNAYISFNNTFNHPNANTFQGTEKQNYYLGKPFIDYLKNTGDPRLAFIAVKYANPAGNISSPPLVGTEDTNPANQEGMPYGYNESTISTAPGFPGKTGAAYNYSQLNRRTVARNDVPEFFITNAQTQLLLAEAAFRGFITGDPAGFYDAGVRAHMDQMKQFDASAVIATSAQDAYLLVNPYDPAKALEVINTQYWIASFLNGSEAWANFRRSGFPALTPNAYPSADAAVKGDFVHRLVYPVREKSVNTDHYNEAVARMGADNLATRVFWDK
jgi:Starch-binding associating with outer membrane